MRHYKFLCCFCLIFASSCVSTNFDSEENNGKKELKKIINSFIGKTPKGLYDIIGEPQKNEVKFDNKGNITNVVLSYQYVYNFDNKTYDCELYFITNKQQNKIIDVKYNSNKCYYLAMY